MDRKRSDNVFSAIAAAVQGTAGAASGVTAVPNRADGSKAMRVAIKVVTQTEVMYFRVGLSGQTAAAATGYPLQALDGWLTMHIGGATHIAAIRAGAADVVFNMIPLED